MSLFHDNIKNLVSNTDFSNKCPLFTDEICKGEIPVFNHSEGLGIMTAMDRMRINTVQMEHRGIDAQVFGIIKGVNNEGDEINYYLLSDNEINVSYNEELNMFNANSIKVNNRIGTLRLETIGFREVEGKVWLVR